MAFLLLARAGALVLVPAGFPGDRLCWSLAELLDSGFRVVAEFDAPSWLAARDLVA
jgi:hypothetical protein